MTDIIAAMNYRTDLIIAERLVTAIDAGRIPQITPSDLNRIAMLIRSESYHLASSAAAFLATVRAFRDEIERANAELKLDME